MAEILLLLAIKKLGIALANGAADQAKAQFAKCASQLIELQGSMGRVVRELNVMHAVLCKMDIRNRNDQIYEGWLDGVRKVAHAMEDMMDEYVYLVGREHDIGCRFYLKKLFRKPKYLLSLNQIASRVKEIERDLIHLSKTRDRWVRMINNEDTSSSNYIVKMSQDLANISLSLDEEDLTGVDENREKLKQWLAGDDLDCIMIVLLGMGGLGKTALAANVFRKEREKFQCHAWVSVSQTYSTKDVLRNVIKGLFKDKASVPFDIATMNLTSLKEALKSFLEQQKYLIILDDVWTPEAFDDLSKALIRNDKGSRLVITTREGDVAALAPGHTLTLEALPEDKAWDLFCKKSFPRAVMQRPEVNSNLIVSSWCNLMRSIKSFLYLKMKSFPRDTNHECPAELKPLSKEIVSKCKGLTLAIVSVGSLLFVREKTMEEWRRINVQLSWELINNSRLGDVRNVLHLSFIYLPTYLKSCFLYCSLFPEEYMFHRKKLVRLWVAEGFIEERGGSTLEEVAASYLKELVHRNMLQLVEKNSFDRMRRFKMHDILRELAVDLCQKDCFRVAYEEGKCGGSLETGVRRLVVHELKEGIEPSIPSTHHLPTVITLYNSMPSLTLLPLIFEKSRYLTVLELSGLPIEKIPDAIGDLFNLRHLGLRRSKVKLLPKSIEKLSNLLTLDLYRSDIQELPRGVVKLKKLRHLFAEKASARCGRELRHCYGVRIPKGLENLIDLQTLKGLEAQDESVRHLEKLSQLRSLRIWNVKEMDCECLCDSLVKMRSLSNLLVGTNDEKEILRLNALPPSLQKLSLIGRLAEGVLDDSFLQAAEHNLYSLSLYWSQLRQEPLPFLSRLSNLTNLNLARAYMGEQLVFLDY